METRESVPQFSVIVNLRFGGHDFLADGLPILEEAGSVEMIEWDRTNEAEALSHLDSILPEIDAIVVGPWLLRFPMTADRLKAARKLKAFAGTFDNRFTDVVSIAEAEAHGVVVIDTSRSMAPTMGEFTLAMTLNLLRDIPAAIDLVRKSSWPKFHNARHWDQPDYVYGDLGGKRVGMVGFGSIGRYYAKLIAPFDCSLQVYDPYVSDEVFAEHGAERIGSLVELASNSQIFVVAIPPTPQTAGLIDREVVSALPCGSLFVLPTRMAVVEQEPLWERIREGEIRAAIDVWEPEPPPLDAWFRRDPNVLPTPHIAAGTVYCHKRCFADACKDVLAVLQGEKPRFEATELDEGCYKGTLGGEN